VSDPTEAQYLEHVRDMERNVVDGYVKIKLVHAGSVTLLVPDLLAVEIGGDLKWFQPKFFYACRLSFFDSFAAASIDLELSSGAHVRVTLTSDQLLASLNDGAQVYRSLISSPNGLLSDAAGSCSLMDDGDFLLTLFHHTTDAAAQAIGASGHFRGSSWNVQGTRELKNVAYAYFTSLPKIESEEDLAKIAMASDGRLILLPTNATSRRQAIPIKVYRQSTTDRTATLEVGVPSSLIASQHVYLHPAAPVYYYELCHPEIYRVGLQPGRVAQFQGREVSVSETDLRRFDYVVLGNADTPEGLVAPYDEEETTSLFYIERCKGVSFLEFWRENANTDRVSWRSPEMLQFERK
jgi:hypothetical protein